MTSRYRHRSLLMLAAAAATAMLVFPGFARAEDTAWIRLSVPSMLRGTPGPAGPPLSPVPTQDQEDLPIAVPVLRTTTRSGAQWVKVRFGGAVGWIPSADTATAPTEPLPLPLRQRLSALMNKTAAAGALIADSNGRSLFARDARQQRILASNTKLFVTGAAFDRFGTRIGRLLRRILRPSDNELAQQLLTRLGSASPFQGLAATEGFARAQGARVTLADGSGLSRANRSTPEDVVRFLVGMRRHASFGTWLDALPVAGRTGTLAYRLRATAAEEACQAKTGTLHDVSTLSGYCTTSSGRRVVFSLLMNKIDPITGRALQDRMLASLVALG